MSQSFWKHSRILGTVEHLSNYGCPYPLTIGKSYNVVSVGLNTFIITDDAGEYRTYDKVHFKSLQGVKVKPLPPKFKHYYDDQGNVSYTYPESVVKGFKDVHLPVLGSSQLIQRARVSEICAELQLDYCITCSPDESDGFLSIDEWFSKDESFVYKNLLKELLRDFLDKGYMPQEFKLAAEAVIIRVQQMYHLQGAD